MLLTLLRKPATRLLLCNCNLSRQSIAATFPRNFSLFTSRKGKMATMVNKTAHAFTREAFDELMKQRFFFTQAFEIYGG